MSTSEISVMTRTRCMNFVRAQHESDPEFYGRVLCHIEERITGARGPTPKGTRWVEWHHTGHACGRFHVGGISMARESTGQPYTNRTITHPGVYDEDRAKRFLAGG